MIPDDTPEWTPLETPEELAVMLWPCGRCGTRWTGEHTCHCATCHETFTSPSGFDIHRRAGSCIPPSTIDKLHLVRRGPANAWAFTWETEEETP